VAAVSELPSRDSVVPSADELAELWDRLGDEDASRAYDSMTVLGGSLEQAVPFMVERLMSAPLVNGDRSPRGGVDAPALLQPEQLCQLRAIEVLELASTGDARLALAKLAEEAPGRELGQEARAALGRLAGGTSPAAR
jgi:hypothetical protein